MKVLSLGFIAVAFTVLLVDAAAIPQRRGLVNVKASCILNNAAKNAQVKDNVNHLTAHVAKRGGGSLVDADLHDIANDLAEDAQVLNRRGDGSVADVKVNDVLNNAAKNLNVEKILDGAKVNVASDGGDCDKCSGKGGHDGDDGDHDGGHDGGHDGDHDGDDDGDDDGNDGDDEDCEDGDNDGDDDGDDDGHDGDDDGDDDGHDGHDGSNNGDDDCE
ncbi:hypothetical protein RMATCC62417_00456 [Rhizopus microsporus]|nr:hypothetical protein RMATCC62417_00456 [Rhizopus microsporus]